MKIIECGQISLHMLVDIANRNVSGFDGIEAVQELIEASEVAFLIWQDYSQPDGVALSVIKGIQLVRNAKATNAPIEARFTAIRCIDVDQAFAIQKLAGEKAWLQ